MNALTIILAISIVVSVILVGGMFLILIDAYREDMDDEHSDTDNSRG